MFNFALIKKILEIAGEKEEVIVHILEELARLIEHKFNINFVLYLNDRIEDDNQLEQIRDYLENADNLTKEKFDDYKRWLDKNVQFDLTEFWERFEDEMRDLEMDLIEKVRDSLNDEQKAELLKVMDEQNEEIRQAYEELDESVEQ